MTTLIAIILILVASYCGFNWGRIIGGFLMGQIAPQDFDQFNDAAFKLGLCGILAAGFAGLLLK